MDCWLFSGGVTPPGAEVPPKLLPEHAARPSATSANALRMRERGSFMRGW